MDSTRRTPTQTRSRATVTAIVDACRDLLGGHRPEAITTTMIAERAMCSPAALYRFFASREAVFAAIVDQDQRELAQLYRDALDPSDPAQPAVVLETVFEIIVDFVRTRPGFAALWWSEMAGTTARQRDRTEGNGYIAARLQAVIEPERQHEPISTRYLVAVEIADHLIEVAFRHHPNGDHDILNEARRVLRLALIEDEARPQR